MAKRKGTKRRTARRYAGRIKRRVSRAKPKIFSLLHLYPTAKSVVGIPEWGIGGAYQFGKDGGIQAGLKEFVDVMSIQYLGYKPSDGSFWGLEKPVQTYATHGAIWITGKILQRFIPPTIRKKLSFGGWRLI